MPVPPPRQARLSFTVADDDTASVLGSGDVPVLGTPRLVAWLEAATVAAAAGDLEPGQTTVGTRVDVQHLAASGVGARVEVAADLVEASGRSLRFAVSAAHADGTPVAAGEVTRAVVDRQRFLAHVGR